MLKKILFQLVILFIVFNAISLLRESQMLSGYINQTEPTLTVPTLMDGDIVLAAKGKKTVLYFFAPWCKVCHLSIDNLQTTYLKQQNINVIAVALDYIDKNDVNNFIMQHQLTFPIALGNETIKQHFKISAYPSYYVLNEKNEIVGKSLGYSTELGLYLRTL